VPLAHGDRRVEQDRRVAKDDGESAGRDPQLRQGCRTKIRRAGKAVGDLERNSRLLGGMFVAFALDSAYSFRSDAEYEVTIGTVLTVFVGEPGDAGAGLYPLRIPVSTFPPVVLRELAHLSLRRLARLVPSDAGEVSAYSAANNGTPLAAYLQALPQFAR